MSEGIRKALEQIKQEGLPDTEEMRADLVRVEAENFQQELKSKVEEYYQLFREWKQGNLNEKETARMFELMSELEKLQAKLEGDSTK